MRRDVVAALVASCAKGVELVWDQQGEGAEQGFQCLRAAAAAAVGGRLDAPEAVRDVVVRVVLLGRRVVPARSW